MGRFLEKVGWGGQLGGIQNQPGGFEEKCLVTLDSTKAQNEIKSLSEKITHSPSVTRHFSSKPPGWF